MPAYLVIEITPSDADAFAEYEVGALAVATRHGAVPLARDTDALVIERGDQPAIAVVLQFPDKQAVRAYFDDPEYAPLRRLRHSSARTSAIAIEA